MNGKFHIRDVGQFESDLNKLQTVNREVESLTFCISNPTCGAARHNAGDTDGEYSSDEISQILTIKRKPKIKAVNEALANIKQKYGVTIVMQD